MVGISRWAYGTEYVILAEETTRRYVQWQVCCLVREKVDFFFPTLTMMDECINGSPKFKHYIFIYNSEWKFYSGKTRYRA